MERFHIITLVVASVSLILVLTTAGILLTKDKRSQKFPTSHKDVPDGWTKSSDPVTGYKLTHTNDGIATDDDDTATDPVYTNPTDMVGPKSFTGAVWKDIDICIKKAWADQNDVYWDGITTYNGC